MGGQANKIKTEINSYQVKNQTPPCEDTAMSQE